MNSDIIFLQELAIKHQCAFKIRWNNGLYPGANSNTTVAVEAPTFAKEIENKGFKDGNAVVKLQLEGSFVGDSRLQVNIKQGNDIVQTMDYLVYVGDAIDSSLSNVQAVPGDYNRWQLVFDIENLSNTNLAEGKIRVNSPEMFAGMNVDIGRVLSGKTSRIRANCPQVTKKAMYQVDYDIILKNGDVYNFKKALDFTITPKRKSEVVVDGKISPGEWDYDTAMVSDSAENVVMIPDWSGTEDLSARTMLMWDEEKLYLYAEVVDDVFNNTKTVDSLWDGDSVQFGIYYDENAHIAIGQGNTEFNEIGIALLKDGPGVYKFKDQHGRSDKVGEITNCEAAVVRDGKKTKYEFAISWEELMGEKLEVGVGKEIGYSILYNDDDGAGRRGWIEYASGIGMYKNTDVFTYLKFVE